MVLVMFRCHVVALWAPHCSIQCVYICVFCLECPVMACACTDGYQTDRQTNKRSVRGGQEDFRSLSYKLGCNPMQLGPTVAQEGSDSTINQRAGGWNPGTLVCEWSSKDIDFDRSYEVVSTADTWKKTEKLTEFCCLLSSFRKNIILLHKLIHVRGEVWEPSVSADGGSKIWLPVRWGTWKIPSHWKKTKGGHSANIFTVTIWEFLLCQSARSGFLV